LEALLVSAGVVALAEIGDKTQLLALLLAARFGKPIPIVLGILVATLANHAFASAVGNWLVGVIGADSMRWILGVSFLAMAAWTLVPDAAPDESAAAPRFGVFLTTAAAFFVVEMGDKTQIATVALAAIPFDCLGRTRHDSRHAAGECTGGVSRRCVAQACAAPARAHRGRAGVRRSRDLRAGVRLSQKA